ncbi:MAG: dihydroorotase [Candidatus Magasanikbacteria bacterium]
MLIKTYNNQNIKLNLDYTRGNLFALPALIDPHVHFRTPGAEHKENWITGAQAALAGGVTTVFDMPNNTPSTISTSALQHKINLIDYQLKEAGILLRYKLWFGATPNNLGEIEKLQEYKDQICGIKIFMGSSTGNLLVNKKEDQAKIFEQAARLDLVVAVHAESESKIQDSRSKISNPKIQDHSIVRSREAAAEATNQAIELAKQFGTKLYILHVSTKEEIEIISQAKRQGIQMYAEVTPHHLFLDESAYDKLGTKAQMNPPLRTTEDRKALWQAIDDGTIDTIGTDHAPHTLEEKALTYPNSPSGVPGIETSLPLLLDAHNKGKISLEKIVQLTRKNIEKIFKLEPNNDWVIVDLNMEKEVRDEDLKTKCGWSPFEGWELKGWPVAVILQGKLFHI